MEVKFIDGPARDKIFNLSDGTVKLRGKFVIQADVKGYVEYCIYKIRQDENGQWIGEITKKQPNFYEHESTLDLDTKKYLKAQKKGIANVLE